MKNEIILTRLVNAGGHPVVLSNLGAGIISVIVPDRAGRPSDVALGYHNPTDYMSDGPGMGKTPGRYANRIARGHFSLDGKSYSLVCNCGSNALHGGPEGFHNRIWDIVGTTACSVEYRYTSADNEEGYPGQLTASVKYTWDDSCRLRIEFKAVTDTPTVINLTNHAYWNLAGHNAGSVLDHTLRLYASHYLPTDDTLVPTGVIAPVTGTPMDFTTPKALGRDLRDDFPALNFGKGYDNCWVIDNYRPGEIRTAAILSDSVSGRTLRVSTDQPGLQVYTGNWLSGCPAGKSGAVYHDYDGVAIECQDFPDSPNHPDFPPTTLRPGETYRRTIIYAFSSTPGKELG